MSGVCLENFIDTGLPIGVLLVLLREDEKKPSQVIDLQRFFCLNLAEQGGFEPPEDFTLRTLSRRVT